MSRLRHEDGSLIVISMMVALIMLLLALGTLAFVDTQARQSGRERVRESSFNLAEGALNAQTFSIGRKGVGTLATPFPVSCTEATVGQNLCPDATSLAKSFPITDRDYAPTGNGWATRVRDNGPLNGAATTIYSAAVDNYPRYDANGDNQMFVKASANVKNESSTVSNPRDVVALVALQDQQISFPKFTISANYFSTSNSGNKEIVDATTSGGVELRCSGVSVGSCLDIKRPAQITGTVTQNSGSSTAISADDLNALVDYADSLGTHYTGCPSNYAGAVVVIDSGNCTLNSSAGVTCCNSATAPGLLIVKSGTLTILGNTVFNGIVYMVNAQNSNGNILTLGGTSEIVGGAVIDGNGGMVAGASGLNVKFGPQAFDSVSVAGTAGVVQNTFREL